ncbi:serine/threonine-protein kinase [Solicola gregarius]|uniref:non-specific serine/threonine protein kinase n=1 Tax=Solicola gregarius TaxID=2908642 RepID=A0AA46YJY4_9ACTN|nr:serine/threonine-protein kinase [Solicola gregarius]UYM03971.1 serine/threonine protein kinase [Solicola gregarius]
MSLPHRLGRLRRISRIGSGGFATVWLYSDPDLQSYVAVKALADNWAARTDIRDRFLEEARILRRADSDHIVRVYDIGETDDGTPYFVMNYADRGTVAGLLNSPSRDLALIADLVSQAGAGLRRLHSMGILHRDVKPQNLLLAGDHTGSSRLMVADLGVAKAMLHASGITQVVGTPAYMAPEQADPTRGVDNRCDVHALGAVAYHLVTGRPVRTGGVEALFSPEPIRPPTTLVRDLPVSLDQVVLRAVAPDPAHRWPDVDSFSTAFVEAASRTHTRMYEPPRIESQVWHPDFPSPVSPPPLTPQSPVPPSPQSPVPPSSGRPTPPPRSSVRRSLFAVLAALVVVAVVVGAVLVLQELSDDDPAAGPDIELAGGWSDAKEVGESTWSYTSDEADLELVVSTAASEESVDDAAKEYMNSIESDGYTQEASKELTTEEQLGDWQVGWDLEYSKGDRYYWRWYFGNTSPETAGWVEINGPESNITSADQRENAEALLKAVREEVVVGTE